MKVAYFTMEIGLSESIPTYSGGLGILAGDHVKSAADMGVPLVVVTLLYKRGFFIQNIDPDGNQQEGYPVFDPRAFMEPLPLKINVKLFGRDVAVGVWKYNQQGRDGKVAVYFLDTDLPDNSDEDRLITIKNIVPAVIKTNWVKIKRPLRRNIFPRAMAYGAESIRAATRSMVRSSQLLPNLPAPRP